MVRAAERLRFPDVPDDDDQSYEFEALNFKASGRDLNGYLAHFRPRSGGARLHAHDAAEFLYVLSGTLLVHVDGEDHRLDAGDSIHINSRAVHGYAQQGDAPCEAVVVTTADPGASTRVDEGVARKGS